MLTVIRRADYEPRFKKRAAWHCQCACGKTSNVIGKTLRRGDTRSCGCQIIARARERWAHRRGGESTYQTWSAMKTRCYNSRQPTWENYGGRGITICDAWRDSFDAFLRDMGPRPKGCTIDRINNDGNYEPENCRWATCEVQANNCRSNRRLSFQGETHTVSEWERLREFRPGTLKNRIQRGWSTDRALTAPLGEPQHAEDMRQNQRLEWNGETMTLIEWADRRGMRYATLDQRLRAGWTVERALNTPVGAWAQQWALDGQTQTIAEWARLRGFRAGTIKRRIQLGWSLERALTVPLRKTHFELSP